MLNRTLAPAFQRSTSLTLLEPLHIPLPNGSQLYVVKGGTQEVMRLELIVPAGKWYEPAIGVAHFTANQLDKGTSKKNSFEIASVFDSYGASIDVSAGNDFLTIVVYTLSKRLPEVLSLVAEVIQEATFPENELALAKDIALQNLKVNEEKTSYLAGNYFRKALFGVHPYGNELDALSIEQIQSTSLGSYHKSSINNFSLIAAGNISDADINQLIGLFGNLPAKTKTASFFDASTVKPTKQYIEKKGSVQSTIRYGMRTINRMHPDFFDLLFVTHLLGGYFGSRLMKNIREEKGLTYGIFASVQPLRNDAFFVIGADVNKENRHLTLTEINNELLRMQHEEVGDGELTTACNQFIGSLQLEMTNAFAHADKYKTILLNNLSSEYYQQMINRVDAITQEDVMRIATHYFNPEAFTEVSVG